MSDGFLVISNPPFLLCNNPVVPFYEFHQNFTHGLYITLHYITLQERTPLPHHRQVATDAIRLSPSPLPPFLRPQEPQGILGPVPWDAAASSQQDVPKDHGGFVGELDLEFVKKHQNIDDHSQQARDISQWTWLENLLNDLKHENASPTTSENLCLTGYLFAWICMNNSCLLISVGSSWEPLRMELSPTMGNDENGPNQIRSISLLSRTWHMDFPREMCYDLDRNSIDPHFKMGKSLDI